MGSLTLKPLKPHWPKFKVVKVLKTHWDVVNLTHKRVVSSHICYKDARTAVKQLQKIRKLGRNWPKVRR